MGPRYSLLTISFSSPSTMLEIPLPKIETEVILSNPACTILHHAQDIAQICLGHQDGF